MEQSEEENYNIKETDEFILVSDKKQEYKSKLFISNNDLFCIELVTTCKYQLKKYFISLTMNELLKDRFFKMFINLEEVFRELE